MAWIKRALRMIMHCSKRIKPLLECIQIIATLVALLVGGIWTYKIFLQHREDHAQLIVEQQVAHFRLSDEANLLRVNVSFKNTGHTLIKLSHAQIDISRLVPLHGCAQVGDCVIDKLNEALASNARSSDRFPWPMIASRQADFNPQLSIEPGEAETKDFEFVLSPEEKVARVYTYVRNDESRNDSLEYGWHTAGLYDIQSLKNAEKVP